MRTALSGFVIFAVLLGLFALGVLVGEQRAKHGVQQKACHLVGGRWWSDRSQCVEYVQLPLR